MRCFIPSLLPALPVHPPGGEPSAAGSDEGDRHMTPHASHAVRSRQPHTHMHSHYMCLVIFVCTVYHGLYVMAIMRANSSDHERSDLQ